MHSGHVRQERQSPSKKFFWPLKSSASASQDGSQHPPPPTTTTFHSFFSFLFFLPSPCVNTSEESLRGLAAIRTIGGWGGDGYAARLIAQKHFPLRRPEAQRVSSGPIRAHFLFPVTWPDLEGATGSRSCFCIFLGFYY